MKKNHDLVDIEADLIHQTDAAYLIKNDRGEKVWLQKSVVAYNEDDKVFTMPENYAIDKGLV